SCRSAWSRSSSDGAIVAAPVAVGTGRASMTPTAVGAEDSSGDEGPRVCHAGDVRCRDPDRDELAVAMRLKILLSFAYYAKDEPEPFIAKMCLGDAPDVFLDSGAFSAMTLGKRIALSEYVAWLKRWSAHVTRYANLDVIGDAE